ncbi:HIT family protein [Blastococcus sp. SYSU DS0539]
MVDCLFCRTDDQAVNRILCENDSFFARLDNFPATEGHVEIVPRRHVVSFFDLMEHEVSDAYALLKRARKILDQRLEPDGYTIGVNEGEAAGRTVHHLHIHLIPRAFGDVEDPRGGIRRSLPNGNPDLWTTDLAIAPARELPRLASTYSHKPSAASTPFDPHIGETSDAQLFREAGRIHLG